jgi:hypothetical protein
MHALPLLLTLALLTSCAERESKARTDGRLRIHNAIGDDQVLESVTITVAGGAARTLDVSQLPGRRHRSLLVEIPDGVHQWSMKGRSLMKRGAVVPLHGRGVIARYDWITRRLLRDAAERGVGRAWEQVHGELQSLAGVDLPALALTSAGVVTEGDLAAAENRLGVELPAYYREAVLRGGRWRIGEAEAPVAALAAPAEIVSVWDWIVAYHGAPPEGSNAVWRKRFESLREDLVVGWAGGPVVLRRSEGMLCDDGSPSFEIPVIDHDDFLIEDSDANDGYFAARGNCEGFAHWHAWHSLTSALGAVTGPHVVIVLDETLILRVTGTAGPVQVIYLESPWLFPWIDPNPRSGSEASGEPDEASKARS